MNLSTALLSVEALLTSAVPEDPQVLFSLFSLSSQDYPVAIVYTEQRDLYDKTAREWTMKYAKKEIVTENELLVCIYV